MSRHTIFQSIITLLFFFIAIFKYWLDYIVFLSRKILFIARVSIPNFAR